MRALTVLLFIIAVFVSVPAVTAQEQGQGNPVITALNIPLQRVYKHSLGYRVLFDTSDLRTSELYIPNRWFQGAASQALLVDSLHPGVPYLTIFYADGEFSHLQLVVHRNRAHITWDALDNTDGVAERFNIETLELRY